MMLLVVLGSSSRARGQGSSGAGDGIPFDSRRVVSEVQAQQQSSDNLGNAFLVDSGFDAVPDTAVQTQPAVAFDGTNYLVVWTTRNAVWGTRVDSTGRVIDPLGFLISATAYNPSSAVAFGTNCYLVAWTVQYGGIQAKRVGREGLVLDPTPIDIWAGAVDRVSVAFGGPSFAVVSGFHFQSGHNIYYGVMGATVSENGAVIESHRIRDAEMLGQGIPSVTFGDSVYLVVWQRSGAVVGQFLHRDGTNRGSMFTVSTAPGDPNAWVAFGDTSYLVAWADSRQNPTRIYGARVLGSGYVPDPSGFLISDSAASQSRPVESYDGESFLVAWQDYRNWEVGIRGRRVSEGAQLLDSASFRITSAGWPASRINECVACGAGNCFVLWQDDRNGGIYQIYGARVSREGTVLDTAGLLMHHLSRAFWTDGVPAVASDGQDYLTVWPRATPPRDILGVLVRRGGLILDPAPASISTAPNDQINCAAAFVDTTYLVVWEDYRSGATQKIYGTRVTRSGRLLDSAGIRISHADSRRPAVAADGTDFLVVWEELRGSPSGEDICAARVTEGGVLLDTSGVVLSEARYAQSEPSVCYGAGCYFIAWQDARNSAFQIYCARVSPAGQVLDTAGILVTPTGREFLPSVASGDSGFLVAWQHKPSDQWADIRGARVNSDGVLIDTVPIVVVPPQSPYHQANPSACFDGSCYVVVWTRNGSSMNDVYGRRMAPSGSLLDSFCIGLGIASQPQPHLAANSYGEALVVYCRFTDSLLQSPLNADRIWGRVGTWTGIAEHRRPEEWQDWLTAVPNPFRSAVSFRVVSPRSARIRISDASGRTVRLLTPISAEVGWDGTDENGTRLPPGVYFVQQEAARKADCLKVIKLER